VHLSATAHFSIARAARLLGIGHRNLVRAQTDGARRIDPAALERALVRDREAGRIPVGVVASAGATTLGTIDPLDEIADVCRQHGTWLHVDGAYGAAAMLAPSLRPRLRGIERADSLSFDLHKWMYVGFDASALLLRDPNVARGVFFTDADYVRIPRDPPPEQHAFFHLGPETSRRLRALPAALALMHYGADRIGRNIEHNAECAAYLAAHVSDHPDLELVAEPALSICCFRYAPVGLDVAERDHINAAIRERLQAEGEFFLSATVIDEHPVLRVCIISPATRAEHVERLVDAVIRLGAELAAPVPTA
jgi:aromatic-L-amino-acid decarboxylase